MSPSSPTLTIPAMTRSLKKEFFAFIPPKQFLLIYFFLFFRSLLVARERFFAMIRKRFVLVFFPPSRSAVARLDGGTKAVKTERKSVESFRNHRNLLFVDDSAAFSFEQTNIKICFCRYSYFHGNDFSSSLVPPKKPTRREKKKVTDRIPGENLLPA
jgi:hypothetical protein